MITYRKISTQSPHWHDVNANCLGFSYFVAERLISQPQPGPMCCDFSADDLVRVKAYQNEGFALFWDGRAPVSLPNNSAFRIDQIERDTNRQSFSEWVTQDRWIAILFFLSGTPSTDPSRRLGHAVVIDTRKKGLCTIYDTQSAELFFSIDQTDLPDFVQMKTGEKPTIGLCVTTF